MARCGACDPWPGSGRAGPGVAEGPSRLVVGAARRRVADGLVVREVLIDGWRVEVELEAEDRAALRDRARRGGPARSDGRAARGPRRAARAGSSASSWRPATRSKRASSSS